jgi:hypothetical protein
LKWDQNFYDGRVGGTQLIDLMHTRGKLSSGQELEYALALNVRRYKGLKVVEHGGALGGYRAALTRFPEQRFSVACLCNLGTINPDRLVSQIADIYLADQMKESVAHGQPENKQAAMPVKPIELPESELREKTGLYRNQLTGEVWQLSMQTGKLSTDAIGVPMQLLPLNATLFRSETPIEVEIEFPRSQAQQPWAMRVRIGGQPPVEFETVAPASPTPTQLAEYTGEYFSEELNVMCTLKIEGDKLYYQRTRAPQINLSPTIKDTFTASSLQFSFLRDRQQRISGFKINAGRPPYLFVLPKNLSPPWRDKLFCS